MEADAKPGRKPKHDFNFLEVGEEVELRGKNKIYGAQYAYGFNKTHSNSDGKKLKYYKKDGRAYVKRIL